MFYVLSVILAMESVNVQKASTLLQLNYFLLLQ